jgi:hypothetical protein
MPGQPVVVEGVLLPDGTLVLDRKPELPPGRVRVSVEPVEAGAGTDLFFQNLQEIWERRRAAGLKPRGAEQVEADRRALNEEMAAELDQTARLQEECRQRRLAKEEGEKRP